MPLRAGTRLGPYEILAQIGAGGMGEVYKARDHRLGRDVAVKIVATDRSSDADLLGRLEQEARLAASLNHPNIVAVYDVGAHDGAPYIVSELLDGESLRSRLRSGPMAVRRAIEYAIGLADALAAAHARGVVHRDLKPENIFLTRDGGPKILDFGLAKGSAPALETGAATAPRTLPGVVMGTVGYMSPEQVAGRPVDHRTDIFSLGVVVDEMVTGRRLFTRDTQVETMAAIVQADAPPASTVNAAVPATLDRIIQRCLEKSPGARFQSASDLGFALSTITSSSTPARPLPATAIRSRVIQTASIAIAATLLGAIVTWYVNSFLTSLLQEPFAARPTHFTIDMRSTPVSESPMPLALSPDGSKLVVSVGSYQGAQLYLRSLDRPDLQPIPGSLDAFNPFFSPDGEWIGFLSGNRLKKAPIAGGPVVTICQTGSFGRGIATWGANDTIYFTTGAGLWTVQSSGGEPSPLTTLAAGEIAHRGPALLPGDRALLFTVLFGDIAGQSGASFQRSSRVVVRLLDSGVQRTLIEGASFARFVGGRLLYVKDGALYAAPFDATRLALIGPPVAVSNQVGITADGQAQLALSADGTLAYLPPFTSDRQSLAWVDRHGVGVPLPLGERAFETPRLSPDGTRVATLVRDKGQADVWVQERSGALSRLTFDGAQTGLIWAPAGDAITFSTLMNGKSAIVSQRVEGDRASHVITTAEGGLWPGSWSRDGRVLAYMGTANAGDVNVIRLPSPDPVPIVNTPATEWGARLSPDEKWMAYASNETGRWEVYVKPYPGPGARRQISTDGGSEIVWARNGSELFYRNGTKLMAVDIQTTPVFAAGGARVLFEGTFAPGQPGLPGYDVSPDGTRFLMVKPGNAEAVYRPIHVVLGWLAQLKRQSSTK